jgi:hypothetical protein
MRAYAQADVERAFKMEARCCAGGVQWLPVKADKHGEMIAALLDAQARGRVFYLGEVQLCASGYVSLFWPELQSGETNSVQDGIGIDGIGIEGLTNDQCCLAMRIASRLREANICRKGDIAGSFCPEVLECILCHPHILAGTGDCVGSMGRVVETCARVKHCPDIGVAFKYAKRFMACLSIRLIAQRAEDDTETYQSHK